MRPFAALALMSLVSYTFAEDTIPVVLYEAKDAQGHKVEFRSDAKALWEKPQWGLGGEDPPLSIKDANDIAYKAVMRQFPKADGVSYQGLKLLRNAFGYSGGRIVTWFYVISAEPVFQSGEHATWGPPVDIVILLDGTVLEPTPVK